MEGLINGVLNVQPRTTGVNSYGILNSWHRFSHGAIPTNGIATYPNRPDELNSWTVDSNDNIKSTENSRVVYWICFSRTNKFLCFRS